MWKTAPNPPDINLPRGRAAAYERLAHNQDLLSLLARGDREIAVGAGYDLDEVLVEADDLLAEGTA